MSATTRYDGGSVIKRGRTEILPNDTVDSLISRHITQERAVQIAALRDVEEGREKISFISDLVRPEERRTLSLAKQIARRKYTPHGDPIENPKFDRVTRDLSDLNISMDEVNLMLKYLEPQQ